MALSFTVQVSEEQYRIVASSGEESSTVVYGDEPACLQIDGEIYYCYIEDPDEPELKVYRVARVDELKGTAVEEVAFEDDGEDGTDEAPGPVLVEAEDEP